MFPCTTEVIDVTYFGAFPTAYFGLTEGFLELGVGQARTGSFITPAIRLDPPL